MLNLEDKVEHLLCIFFKSFPKAEPFKQWMAQVASQRIDQMQDPELSITQSVGKDFLCL